MNNFSKKVELDTVCQYITVGFVGSMQKEYVDKGVPLLRSLNIKPYKLDLSDIKFISEEFHQKISKSSLKKNDVVVVRTGLPGTSCVIEGDVRELNCSDLVSDLVIVRTNSEKVDPYYLSFYFNSIAKKFVNNHAVGAIQQHFNVGSAKKMIIDLPSIRTQRKISTVLNRVNKKIELNNRFNTELEAMAKLIYEYWFVQFDFPFDFAQGKSDSNGKPYKSSGGKMVWNKELKREIPEGWERGDLKDLADFNPSLKIERNSEAPYIGMTSISTTGYMTDVPEKKEFSGGIKFQNGDVVVARITPCLENGKTALITLLGEGSIGFGSTEFINIRAKEKSHISFLAILSRSDSFRHYAISKMTGTSGRKRVDANELAKFQLPVPPDDLLKKYGDLVDPYFQKMTSNSKQNHELASLRDWLLPMLMNGQVTVVDAEEMVEEKLGMVAEPVTDYERPQST